VWLGLSSFRQLLRGQHLKLKLQWSSRKLEMPGTWNICQGRLQAVGRASLGERPCRLQLIGHRGGLSKPFGSHIMHHFCHGCWIWRYSNHVFSAGLWSCFGPILSCCLFLSFGMGMFTLCQYMLEVFKSKNFYREGHS
jgi:hypothetical protein